MKSVAVDNARTGKKIKSLRIENQVIDDEVDVAVAWGRHSKEVVFC